MTRLLPEEQKLRILEVGRAKDEHNYTWQDVADLVNEEFGSTHTNDSVRNVCFKNKEKKLESSQLKGDIPTKVSNTTNRRGQKTGEPEQSETIKKDGSREIATFIYTEENGLLSNGKEKTPENVMSYLGYDPDLWEMVNVKFGSWNVAIRDEPENRICHTVKLFIKPRVKQDLELEEVLQAAAELIRNGVPAVELPPVERTDELDANKLFVLPQVELHLGKLAWAGDSTQNYDYKIAAKRYEQILEECVRLQQQEQAKHALMIVGGDYFNSDNFNMTTTMGTPQQSDMRPIKVFQKGCELKIKALETFRQMFDKVTVLYCPGNHDRLTSAHLYMVLQAWFKDAENIEFGDEYRSTQAFKFGRTGLFFNHGDANEKRLRGSIPAEFKEVWGTTDFHELLVGHWHKEMVTNDENGLVLRRLPAPTATDAWHYDNRYIGAAQGQHIMIYDSRHGHKATYNVSFPSIGRKRSFRLNG